MKITRIGISGTRKPNLTGLFALKQTIKAVINNYEIKEINFGGAIGIDTYALIYSAEEIVLLKREDVLLRVIVPDTLKAQPDYARFSAEYLAGEILELKNEITRADNFFSFRYRNEEILKRSDLILAFWNGNKEGGTYHMIKSAEKHGIRVEKFLI
jgi:uncharacterized phage-like protein YoqJ